MTKKQTARSVPTEGQPDGIAQLKTVLADTFVLYMKTYAVHWNFEGPNFFSVHKLTEGQYENLADAVDEIAERIRAKGTNAPVSLTSILGAADLREMATQKESFGDLAIQELVNGHDLLAERAKEAALALESEGDSFSHDMLIARVGAHEKSSWMLRSLLKD